MAYARMEIKIFVLRCWSISQIAPREPSSQNTRRWFSPQAPAPRTATLTVLVSLCFLWYPSCCPGFALTIGESRQRHVRAGTLKPRFSTAKQQHHRPEDTVDMQQKHCSEQYQNSGKNRSKDNNHRNTVNPIRRKYAPTQLTRVVSASATCAIF